MRDSATQAPLTDFDALERSNWAVCAVSWATPDSGSPPAG